MKKNLLIVLTVVMVMLITACGGSNSGSGTVPAEKESESETVNEQTETGDEEETAEEKTQEIASDTISVNGYTVKIVGLHKTKDSNGDPIAAAEFLFTNENTEPVSLMGATSIIAFQNGIELHKDEMFLEDDYDWDSYDTEIKDGATISVFHAIPLQNETDPVELSVDIMNFSDWTPAASTTVIVHLDSDTEPASTEEDDQADIAKEQTETAGEEETAEERIQEPASDTISANGYTIQIVGLHKTKDSNGEPMAAAEFLFTNENAEPISFMGVASTVAFQNGIELHKDEMFLEDDYDWDSYDTEIKDGATISVFHAVPLQNETDPVELTVDIIDFSNWTSAASTTVKIDLND